MFALFERLMTFRSDEKVNICTVNKITLLTRCAGMTLFFFLRLANCGMNICGMIIVPWVDASGVCVFVRVC